MEVNVKLFFEINSYGLHVKLSKHDYVNVTWEYASSGGLTKIEGGNTGSTKFNGKLRKTHQQKFAHKKQRVFIPV